MENRIHKNFNSEIIKTTWKIGHFVEIPWLHGLKHALGLFS